MGISEIREKIVEDIVAGHLDKSPYVRLYAWIDSEDLGAHTLEKVRTVYEQFWNKEQDPLFKKIFPNKFKQQPNPPLPK